MLEVIQTYHTVFRVGLIIIIGLFAYYGIGRFGKGAITLALTKKRTTFAKSVELSKDEEQRIETLSIVINKIGGIALLIIVGTMILSELGVAIGPILAGAGVAGIAIGLGAQSIVKDVLAGLLILVENQFVKGDTIKVGEVSGKVTDLSLRRTVLRDMSGVEHHIPNGEMKIVSNYTKDWANINMDISVEYDSDINQVTTVLNDVAEQLSNDPAWKVYVLTQPTVLGVQEFGASALVMKLHGRVDADQQWAIQRELRKRIKQSFDHAGINIPYPHVVTIKNK